MPKTSSLLYLALAGVTLLLPAAAATQVETIDLRAATKDCAAPAEKTVAPPASAASRLPQSHIAFGIRDIASVWLGDPTSRYPHTALGSKLHAQTLYVAPSPAATSAGAPTLSYTLPPNRVFEDRLPRLVDLDEDGRDEIVLVEADAALGAALVVFGIRDGAVTEVARGPHVGSAFRWLNPVGAADFDGDGKTDLASVTTPHIGGVLTLHHFKPPRLEPYARHTDVSNHRMGDVEQQLAVVVTRAGQRPTILVPDMQLQTLLALRWDAPGQWVEVAPPLALSASVQRFTHLPDGGCLLLTNGSWWRVRLSL